jgi:hypothetical protein
MVPERDDFPLLRQNLFPFFFIKKAEYETVGGKFLEICFAHPLLKFPAYCKYIWLVREISNALRV